MKKKEKSSMVSFEKIQEEIENRKKIPHNEKVRIFKHCIYNLLIFVFVFLYFCFLLIGEENLETDLYIKILKGCSIGFICISIILFEASYRTNKNSIILHSLESLVLSLYTLFSVSAYSLYYGRYSHYIIISMLILAMYFILKIFGVYRKKKNDYLKSLSDMKTIVAKRKKV